MVYVYAAGCLYDCLGGRLLQTVREVEICAYPIDEVGPVQRERTCVTQEAKGAAEFGLRALRCGATQSAPDED